MILPAQFANEVHEGDKTLFCPYCSRILFYQESDGSEEDYYSMAEAGSLSDDLGDEFADEKLDDDEEYSDNENYTDKSSDYDEDIDDEDDSDESDDSDDDSE